jgi:hypothetical protein
MFDILCFASFYLQTPSLIGALFLPSLRLLEMPARLACRVRQRCAAAGSRLGLAPPVARVSRVAAGFCR